MPEKRNSPVFGRSTILARIMLPGIAVILVQLALYMLIFWQYNIIERIETNAYDMLSEKVLNRQQDIQSDILHKCMALDGDREFLLQKIYASLAENNAAIADISTSPALNRKIVADLSDDIVNMLYRNAANGIFLVLDGPAAETTAQGAVSRAGCYIRQFDRLGRSSDNGDLLMERGMPDLARGLNIAFDRCWSASFAFTDEETAQSQFFFAPLNAAKAHNGGKSADFGYWSERFSLSDNDINIITYSVPLIADDGTVFGVFGVEVSESQLTPKMRYHDLSGSKNASYFLGVSSNGGLSYRSVFTSGPLFKHLFGKAQTISVAQAVRGNVHVIGGVDNGRVVGAVAPLEVYRVNTPFYHEQWAVIGLIEQDDLLYFSNKINTLAHISFFISLLLGLAGVLIIGKMVTDPVSALVASLKQSDPAEPIHLKKTNIVELDELVLSFEALSYAVANASEKIAKIFAMTQISVGVFEYDLGRGLVFCSSNLCSILDWPERPEKDYIYLERGDFEKRMLSLSRYVFEKSERMLQIFDRSGKTRWLKIHIAKQGGRLLGAVSDITDDVLSKQKIEYERDYDALTNLYNLRAFRAQLTWLMHLQNLKTAALVMWDLDNLKKINDNFGHDFGDSYIKAFADCLADCTRHNALVARRSGDEFYTLLYGYDSKQQIREILAQVHTAIRQKQLLFPDGSVCLIDVSSGLAWYPDDAASSDELLRFADFAMYSVKHDAKGSLREFDSAVYYESVVALDGYKTIMQLIGSNLVKFALQPILSVQTGVVYGYEMLMRPQIPGDYSTYDVFHMAQVHAKLYHMERISMFGGMDAFVTLVNRRDIGATERVFINSIGSQILNYSDILAFERRFAPYLHRITIEVTASGRDNQDSVHMKRDILKRWGGLLAIDDYGVSFGNEAALHYIAPKLIKLDISLISGIDQDKKRQDTLRSIVATAEKHQISVLAEGIETEEELKTAIASGVHYVQGFFIAKPAFDITPIPQTVLEAVAAARQADGDTLNA